MTLNFFIVLTLISIFLTTLLLLFFMVTKKGYKTQNKILAFLLLIFNLQIIYSFLTSSFTFQYFFDWHKPVFLIRQTSFLIGPLIYFYIHSFLKRKVEIQFSSLLHFLPFVAACVFLLIFYRYTNRFIIWESKIDLYSTIILLVHNFIYLTLCVLSLKSTNVSFKDFYRNIKISSHNTWLQVILLGFIVIWVINLNSFAIIMISRKPGWCAYTGSIYALVAFLFVNAIMFVVLLNPEIYYTITKYKSNKLKETDKREYLQRLNYYMETSKAFLNPDITLELLADEISVSPRLLSQIINETYNKNFKSYILEFRIKESMQILADSNYRKLTVLEILYKVGFNSKSSFNNQFKLYSNLTPQEYRSKFIA